MSSSSMTPDKVFYCDLPYVGQRSAYLVSKIDHEEFVEVLQDTERDWLVLYKDILYGLKGMK